MPQTLLLADDSVTIQRVIELTFADEDIDVVAVSDGDQAIARLDDVPPDIVLVDVGMPGKSGYDVAAYVKRSPRLSHIPVVLLTGAFEPVDEARASGAGCDGVLAKPFEPHQVIGRVKELLNRSPRPVKSLDSMFSAPQPLPRAEPVPPAQDSKAVDDYFDQLDAAFSNLPARPPQGAESTVPAEIDWFGLKHTAPESADAGLAIRQEEAAAAPQPLWARAVPDVPSPPAVPEPPTPEPAEPEPVEPEPPAAASLAPTRAPEPVAPADLMPAVAPAQASAPAPVLPPLADAFAALLEAERRDPQQSAPFAWPATPPTDAFISTSDLVEQVSRKVLEQLTDRVVRETVTTLAERLIREEIERIKKNVE